MNFDSFNTPFCNMLLLLGILLGVMALIAAHAADAGRER